MPSRSQRAQQAETDIRRTWVTQRREARSAQVPRLLQAHAGVQLDISAHNILIALADAGPSSITELARQLGTDLSTVSRQVLQPEAMGLIQRMPSTVARQGQVLCLTVQGEALVDRLIDAWNSLLDPVLAGWSDADVLGFGALLQRFVAGLQQEVASRSGRGER